MALVHLTSQFRQDVRLLVARLEHSAGASTADKHAAEIQRSVNRLVDFPGIGAPRPRLGRSIRMLIVEHYLIFYEGGPKAEVATVLRAVDGRHRITRGLVASGRDAQT